MSITTITWQEFIKEAEAFVELSDKLHDNWTLYKKDENEGNSFLVYKQKIPFDKPSETAQSDGTTQNLVQIEYHIVYSISYEVPVLYFQAHTSDGRLLGLEDAWCIFRTFCEAEVTTTNTASVKTSARTRSDMFSILTQMEHPVLFRPYLCLHPCRTAELLAQIGEEASRNRVLTFISLMGPYVQLQLRNEYGLSYNENLM